MRPDRRPRSITCSAVQLPPCISGGNHRRGSPPDVRVELRRAHAAPVFDDLEVWLALQLTTVSGKSPLAAAIRYALGRMERLRPYLDNGILELDTDVVEQPLSQPFCGFGGLSFQASTIAA